MKKWGMILCMVACLCFMVLPSHLQAQTPIDQNSDYQQQLIVKYKEAITASGTEAIHQQMGTQVVKKFAKGHFDVVQVPKGKVKAALEKYNRHPAVEYVEPNHPVQAFWTPNDPMFPSWNLTKIQAPQAWDISRSLPSIKIAIVDTGVDASHPDLANKVIQGYDFVEDDNVSQDENGHGTYVAGIAAAATNNGIGIAGVAPEAKILAVRVLNGSGSGTIADVAAGIQYAADQGSQVINLSLGSPTNSVTLQNAVNYAANKGSLLVAAAGGSASSTPNYPAAYPNVVAVAATDANDRLASFSSYGSWVDIAAPGTNIQSTTINGGYVVFSGTSMAAAHVSGVAALGLALNTNAAAVRNAMETSADPITGHNFGRVNAYKTLLSLQ